MAATAQVEADGRSGWWPRDGRGDGSATGGSEAAVTAAGGRTTTGGATKPTTARRPDPRRRRRCRVEEATTATGGRRRTAARTGAPEGEKKRYCCSSAAASDSIYGFGAKGDAAPRSKIDAPRGSAALNRGWWAGSTTTVALIPCHDMEEKERMNCQDVLDSPKWGIYST